MLLAPHDPSTRSIHKRSSDNHYPVSRSWTQAEFLLSGHSMPRTPDGAPLEWHASFLPLDDKFTLSTDEPHAKPCRGCVPPPPSPSKPPPGTSLSGLTTSSGWHAFDGDEVPLVRQHSQGAHATDPACTPAVSAIAHPLNITAMPPSCSQACATITRDAQSCSASCKPPSMRWRLRSRSARSPSGRARTRRSDERYPLCP